MFSLAFLAFLNSWSASLSQAGMELAYLSPFLNLLESWIRDLDKEIKWFLNIQFCIFHNVFIFQMIRYVKIKLVMS